jgi:hypothetical protein
MAIEAMKLALEALEEAHPKPYNESVISHVEAITALRTAIEQAEKQEPVAWISTSPARMIHWTSDKPVYDDNWKPLYTTPPAAQRKPLTDEEMKLLWVKHGYRSAMCKPFARAIEAAHGIKE